MRFLVLVSAALCLLLSTLQQVSGATIQGKHPGINPADLVTINNKTYYISPFGTAGVSNYDAKLICGGDGMKLLSLRTPEKWAMISEFLINNGYDETVTYWTCGKETAPDKWIWNGIIDLEIKYFEWALIQPDDGAGDDCIHFYQIHGWYDSKCSTRFNFICES